MGIKKEIILALADMAPLAGASSQKVEVSDQGTYLDCGFDPKSGHIWKAANPQSI